MSRGPSHIDSLYRSSHFALDPLLDHFQRSRHKERSRALIGGIVRRVAIIGMAIFGVVMVLSLRAGEPKAGKERALHCFFLLDRSGSMRTISASVVSGFNTYVAQQRQQPGTMFLTLAQFDTAQPFELVHDGVDIHKVPALLASDFQPRGTTPLYDALAMLISHADRHAASGSEVDLVALASH